MASSSDNQGLQIAVIIFALLTIVMSGATFYVFKLSEDAEIRVKAAESEKTTAVTGLGEAITEIEQLKKWCGYDQALKGDALKEAFNKDMQLYGGMNVGEDQRSYSKLLASNFTTLQDANRIRTQEADKVTKLTADFATIETNRTATVTTHKTEAQTAMDQLATRAQTFDESDKKHVKERGDLNASVNTLREQVATLTDKISKDSQRALQEITLLQSQREGLTDKLTELTADEIKVPDGSIRWVSASTRTVWIDVGRGDGVRRQTSFGVWGVDENGVARGPKKASVEVTQLLGEHLAEARILQDDYSNPILIGDRIYTPLWNPGERLHFAICGQIDINKDDVSDLQMIRDLVSTSGGVLDAELLPNGTVQGSMSINTRFLIVGEPFAAKAVAGGDTKSSDAGFGKMQKEAKEMGVQTIPVSRFLDHVGWKDPNRVVQFGRDSNPADFNVNPPLKGQKAAGNRDESEQFRRRPPPSNPSLRSAYQQPDKK